MNSKNLSLCLVFLAASIIYARADLSINESQSYDSETTEVTLNDPDAAYLGTGDERQSPPGTYNILTSLSGTSASTGDFASASASYSTSYAQGSESLALSGTGNVSFSAVADPSKSLFGDASDATQLTFTPDEALAVSAHLQGTSGSVLTLVNSTTDSVVFDLVLSTFTSLSDSANTVLLPGDVYVFGTYTALGTHETAGSPAYSQAANFSYSFDASTPEPSTYALLGLGLGALALAGIKSRSARA